MPRFSSTTTAALFPTCIHESMVEDAGPLNAKLKRRVERLRRETPLWKGSKSPWQCQPDLHTRSGFRPLVELIHQAADQAQETLDWELPPLELTGMWATILSRGEHHPPHSHANNLFSGVYYVHSPSPERAKITFFTPNRAADVWRPTVRKWTPLNSTSWSWPSREGMLLLFPSWLLHYVSVLGEPQERMSIAFNLAPRGPMNVPDSLQHADFGRS